MTRLFIYLSGLVLLSAQGFAQRPQNAPEFEITDVLVSPPGAFPRMSGGMMGDGRYELHSATMLDLIRIAWAVDDANKIIGGPSWLQTDRFEVIGKTAPNTPSDAIPGMLQKLLANRFGLVVHPDKQPLPALALTAGKKPQLKATQGSGEAVCELRQNSDGSQNVTTACHNMTMAEFAARMGAMAGAYVTRPVVDETGLAGTWDFNLTWTALPSQVGRDGITFFNAVSKELGLKLEQKNIPAAVIVVDKVNQTPTPNAPGVTQALPTTAAQFEVAVVKPSAPEATSGGGFQPGGRVDLHAIPLKNLVMTAWALSEDRIADAPKWMSTQRFDIAAKAAAASEPQSTVGMPVNLDAMRTMLRALIVDRFKLAFHEETRRLPVYEIVAVKSQLKKADPANRAGCQQGGGQAPGSTVSVFTYTCQGTTMAQLAGRLRQLIGAQEIDHPVVDATGLDGAWDFEFTWTPPPPPQAVAAANAGPGSTSASDPAGGMSLKEALNKQLGLKLELQKRPLPVLVIDHVEEKPISN
jgi:uncharacterized protein (TIGR03435 family)